MSYILDALKRADAERERGGVPGLNAQPAVPLGVALPSRRPPRALPWWLGGVALLAVAALAWQGLPHDTEPVPLAPDAIADDAGLPPGGEGAPDATAPPPPAPALPPIPAAPEPPAPRTPARAAVAAAPSRAAALPAAASAAASAAAPAGTDPETRLYTREELPPEVRQRLPQLSIGGSIYSTDAASRFLVINGRVFHEGDAITPELTLQEIKLKQAVLKFGTYRYTISY